VTEAQVIRRVTFWAKRLHPLGLAHWRFEVSFKDELPDEDAVARVRSSSYYDTAWLEFRSDWIASEPMSKIDETIIHELLHVCWRDYQDAIDAVDEKLDPITYSDWRSRLVHETEGLVERVARTLYALSGESC
jgi:hypothetical protein